MTTVPTLNFIHVIDFVNYTVFENHTLVVGKWLLYLSKVTIALSVVFFWIFRGKCSFSSPISHVHTWTRVHKMDMSDMRKDLKAWWKLVLFIKNPYQIFEMFISFNWYKNEKGEGRMQYGYRLITNTVHHTCFYLLNSQKSLCRLNCTLLTQMLTNVTM